jgi:hypothetical protein
VEAVERHPLDVARRVRAYAEVRQSMLPRRTTQL